MARPKQVIKMTRKTRGFETFCTGVELPETDMFLSPTRLAEVRRPAVFWRDRIEATGDRRKSDLSNIPSGAATF